jgi:hypothetical protein
MNVHFVTYHPSTGRIIACGFTQAEALEGQADTIVLDNEVDPRTNRVVAGRVEPLPPKPGLHYEFNYSSGAWEYNRARALADVTGERNALLDASDWSQMVDVPMAEEKRAEWRVYRQQLRDTTAQPDLENIVWPTPPQ